MDFTLSEELVIERALLVAIQRFETDLVIFEGKPIAENSRTDLVAARSALKKIKEG